MDKLLKVLMQDKSLARDFDIDIARAYNAGKQAILDQRDGKPFRSSVEYFRTEYSELIERDRDIAESTIELSED